jgi:hypothetical protein
MLYLGQEEIMQMHRISSPSIRSRHSADLLVASIQEKTYARMRSMYDRLGLDGAEFGTWKDVPILGASLQGVKHGCESEAGEETAVEIEDVCESMDRLVV